MTFAVSHEASEVPVSSRSELPAALEENNEAIFGVCESTSAVCYDFANDMPIDEVFWVRDGHNVNTDGAQKKAELVARYLTESNMVPSSQAVNQSLFSLVDRRDQ